MSKRKPKLIAYIAVRVPGYSPEPDKWYVIKYDHLTELDVLRPCKYETIACEQTQLEAAMVIHDILHS